MRIQDRRDAAELHADHVFRTHLLHLHRSTTLDKMANILNEKGIPPVRAGGRWNVMRVQRLLRLAERSWRNR